MQGIVTDENGAYVKAAIVKLYKVKAADEESGAEAATYAETDEDGNFIIQDLNPDEKYIIEIHAEYPETDVKAAAKELKPETEAEAKQEPAAVQEPDAVPEEELEPETEPDVQQSYNDDELRLDLDYEEEVYADEYDEAMFLSDFAAGNPSGYQIIDDTITENISVKNLYISSGINLKDKPYLMRNNLW